MTPRYLYCVEVGNLIWPRIFVDRIVTESADYYITERGVKYYINRGLYFFSLEQALDFLRNKKAEQLEDARKEFERLSGELKVQIGGCERGEATI